MAHWRIGYSLIIFSVIACALSLAVIGPYSMQVDGAIYIAQVEQFEYSDSPLETSSVALRSYKPFPGVFGSLFVPFLSPHEALQFMNIIFLMGLPFVGYALLREIGFTEKLAYVGAIWILFGYPILKYGLTLSTDLGGVFFAFLCAAIGFRALNTNSFRLLILASLIGFIGGTIKETGVLSLVAIGSAILFTLKDRSYKKTFLLLAALAIPALILELTLIGILLHAGFPAFLEWLSFNNTAYGDEHRTLIRLFAVEASTFNMLLIYAGIGLFEWIRNQRTLTDIRASSLIGLGIASLPVLLWPIFISRILFIQILIIAPLALLGVRVLKERAPAIPPFVWYSLPVLTSILLFFLSKEGSLFRYVSLFF